MRAERRERMCVMSDKDRAEFEAWLDSTDYWLTSNPEEIKWHDEWMEDAWQAARAKDAERIAELENIAAVAIANRKSMHRRAEQAEAQLAEHRSTDMKVTMAYLRRREDELEAETEEVRNQSAQDFDRVCENLRASEAELAEAREQYAMARAFPFLKNETPTEGGTS